MRSPLVVANWKMHPATLAEAKRLLAETRAALRRSRGVRLVVAPPAVFLAALSGRSAGRGISFAIQDVDPGRVGPATGDISAAMAKDAGARYAIVGHSERRAKGETNGIVAAKARAALEGGLAVILCVGEGRRDAHGSHLAVVREEVAAVLRTAPPRLLRKLIVAYEPLWAIGKSAGDAMTPRALHEMVIFIRKVIAEERGVPLARRVPVLYGGSVEGANAEALLAEGRADGLLLGRASLRGESLGRVLALASRRA